MARRVTGGQVVSHARRIFNGCRHSREGRHKPNEPWEESGRCEEHRHLGLIELSLTSCCESSLARVYDRQWTQKAAS